MEEPKNFMVQHRVSVNKCKVSNTGCNAMSVD